MKVEDKRMSIKLDADVSEGLARLAIVHRRTLNSLINALLAEKLGLVPIDRKEEQK